MLTSTTSPSHVSLRSFRLAFAAGALLLLAVPLVAQQYSGEVNWGGEDFLAAGVLLALLGTGLDLALQLPVSLRLRAAAVAAAVAAFLLVWGELAVGLFD